MTKRQHGHNAGKREPTRTRQHQLIPPVPALHAMLDAVATSRTGKMGSCNAIPPALARRVGLALEAQQLVNTDVVQEALVNLAQAIESTGVKQLRALSDIISSPVDARVQQWLVLAQEQYAIELQMGGLELGPLGSSSIAPIIGEEPELAELWPHAMVVTLPPITVRILAWETRSGPGSPEYQKYLGAVALELENRLWDSLRRAQAIPVALGCTGIDEERLRESSDRAYVTVFHVGERDARWVTWRRPTPPTLGSDLRDLQVMIDALSAAGHLIDDPSSEFDRTIVRFAEMIARGEQHLARDRKDEAFLHYIIPLDLLLGSRDRTTETVAARGAIVSSGALGRSYGTLKAHIADLYNARSRYVHGGEAVGLENFELLRATCRECLHALLRVRSLEQAQHDGSLREWQRRLDYLAHAREANKAVPREHYRECGINTTPL